MVNILLERNVCYCSTVNINNSAFYRCNTIRVQIKLVQKTSGT